MAAELCFGQRAAHRARHRSRWDCAGAVLLWKLRASKRQNHIKAATSELRDSISERQARDALRKKAEQAALEAGGLASGPAVSSALDDADSLAETMPTAELAPQAEQLDELLVEVDVRIAFGELEVANSLLSMALRAAPGNEALMPRLAQLEEGSEMNDDDWLSEPDDNPFE